MILETFFSWYMVTFMAPNKNPEWTEVFKTNSILIMNNDHPGSLEDWTIKSWDDKQINYYLKVVTFECCIVIQI